ncbi:hypothetical protein QBZ16_001971 [Prototheca wickerhamii]|uniref:Myb-like domain-containing protein n=1 Tax=Prototheca wickerhamii TaxID=3111 RepID=A0AAD9MNU1_PROWI|nr:hypothetical protein QBZ16_001971 [Prototheca wickerhamii]
MSVDGFASGGRCEGSEHLISETRASMTAGAAEDAAAAPAAAAPEPEPVKGESAAEAAQREAEQKARAAHEDRVLERGRAVRGLRALLARAYTAPAREPSRRGGAHWDAVLGEARWLAADVAQERLWKGAAALAVAAEVAGKRGDFGLRAPPEGFRAAHDEIAAAARGGGGGPGGRTRGPASAAARARARRPRRARSQRRWPTLRRIRCGRTWRRCWTSCRPARRRAWRRTRPLRTRATAPLTWRWTARCARARWRATSSPSRRCAATASSWRARWTRTLRRWARPTGARCAWTRTWPATTSQTAASRTRRMAWTWAWAARPASARASAARPRAGARRAGYLLDDFAELPDAALEFSERAPAQRRASAAGAAAAGGGATSRQYIEDTYLRKRRRERYRESDVDYDASAEHAGSASRYGTRRATGALAARPGQRPGGGAPDAAAAAKRLRVAGAARRGARGAPGAARGPGAPAVAWSKPEDELLLATVHEFGLNWTLVSEVLSLSLALQGVYRPPALCRQRFRALTLSADADYSEERALAALGQRLSKAQARELLVAALPARDDALCRALETLVQVGAAAKQRRLAEEKRGGRRAHAAPGPARQPRERRGARARADGRPTPEPAGALRRRQQRLPQPGQAAGRHGRAAGR